MRQAGDVPTGHRPRWARLMSGRAVVRTDGPRSAPRVAVAAALLLVASVGGMTIAGGVDPAPPTGPGHARAIPSGHPAASGTEPPPMASGAPAPLARAVLTWNRQPLDGAAGPGRMAAITAGGSGLVAVGSDTDTTHHHNTPTSQRHHTDALVWRSFGTGAWSRVAGQPGFEHASMQDVAWSEGVLVAVGYDDSDPAGVRRTRIWTSRDGASWRALADETIPADTRLTAILGTVGGFLARGTETAVDGSGRGVVWRSVDGLSWARATDAAAFGEADLWAIFDTGDGLVAVGDVREGPYGPARPVVWRSSDASRWESIPLADDAFGSGVAGIAAITRGGPGYIAVGTLIDTLSPQDPVSTRVWPPTDGAIWTSPDLQSWTRVEPARDLFGGQEDQAITSVVAIRDGYIAFGNAGGAAGAWSSADGQRWERVELPGSASGQIEAAVVMNGEVVGIGGVVGAPAVWRGWSENAANSPSAITGVDYPIAIYSHCGLDRARFDFDGSFWMAIGETSDDAGNPPDGYDNPYDGGTIRLLPDGTAEYTSSGGVRLPLDRLDGPDAYGCY